MSRDNNVLATAIVEVIPNMNNFTIKLRKELQAANFASTGKEVGEEISRGLKLGLDSDSTVRDWMSGISTAISVGRFVDKEMFDSAEKLFAGIGTAAQGAMSHVQGFSATLNAFSVSSDFGLEIAGIAFGKTGTRIAELVLSLDAAGKKFVKMANKQGVAAAIAAAANKLWEISKKKLKVAQKKLSAAMLQNPKILALAAIAGLV
ncbi:MAG: hypothetical protein FWD93_01010, partial [Coriobacteriia bacterium]|nr:hypothetical protein [Coriobacteriia bacterium]